MKLLEHMELLEGQELDQLDQFKSSILTNHNEIEVGRIEAYIDF